MTTDIKRLIEKIRGFEAIYKSNWFAHFIRMKDVTALCNEIERLEKAGCLVRPLIEEERSVTRVLHHNQGHYAPRP